LMICWSTAVLLYRLLLVRRASGRIRGALA
jgi:hypothetical protein